MRNIEKLKTDLQEYSFEMEVISSLAKILLELIENNNDNIREMDKAGLASTLDKMLDDKKMQIADIREDLFGI